MPEPIDSSFPEIPGYRIESILGHGSMARVFRARQLGIDRPVALKVLREEVVENEKILKRLMREARIAARFNHPHIVRALDAGVHEGSCYFVMDLVEGRSIREIVERDGPLDEERALQLAIEIAEALSELHRAHVVHRDVKPANIIVDQDERALLADLGLAKIEFDSSMTSQHRTVGTPAYMAPEQARNPEKVDSRCDLFSLGATIYYMLSGHSPFEGPSVSAVITKILYEEAVPLSRLVPEVSPELEQIVERLLDKDRDRRYPGPSALLRDLRALQRGAALPVGAAAPRRDLRKPIALAVVVTTLLIVLALILIPRGGDDSDAADPSDPEAGTESAELAEREAMIDEEGLERNLDRALSSIESALESKLESGSTEGARAALVGDWRARFERQMGAPLAELPRIARLRWENARLEFEGRIDAETARRREDSLTQLKRLYDGETAALERSPVFLDSEEIISKLEALEVPELGGLDRAAFELLRTQAADRLLGRWRREFDRKLEQARLALADSNHDGSLAILKTLRDRRPLRLGRSALESLESLRAQIDRSRNEIGRRVANALALVDVLPPIGSARLADRQFELLLDRISPVVDALDEEVGEPAAVQLQVAVAVLREAAAWPGRLVTELRADRIPDATELVDRSGQVRRVVDLVEVHDESLSFTSAAGLPIVVSLRELSVETLADLVGERDTALGERTLAFLHYCDGDLLDAELCLAGLAPQDPFRQLMNERLQTAWVEVAHVKTPEGKEAFRIWSATLAAFRAGDHAGAAAAAKPLKSDAALKQSEWYREKRKDIHRVLDEVDLRLAVAERLGPRARRLELTRLDPPVVRGFWSFDEEEEATDFQLPEGHGWRVGELARLAPEAEGRVAPDHIAAIHLELPADPSAHPIEVELEIRGSALAGEEPRCLVISLLGHHVGILSRLRQSLPFRHLELHGAERLVHDYIEFGRVASWSGDLDGYRAAFSKAGGTRPVLFEPGRRYQLVLRLDPVEKSLSLQLDGIQILRRRLEVLDLGISGLDIRAPMPFALESLRLSAALTLD